jgi:hypothetical protein
MAANICIARRILLESPGVRHSRFIDDFIPPHLIDRSAPGVRLEGPDIALSGRQILLKTLI